DPYLDPTDANDEFYAETSVRLPATYWCYQPPANAPEVGPSPAVASGHVTFGCLSPFEHVSDLALITWCALLEASPSARLLLSCENTAQQRRVYEQFSARGIDAQRAEFVGQEHGLNDFDLYRRIDVALDPFPFNSPLHACDALWMGVPVVSLAGQTAVSRAGLSLLANLGLLELIAHCREEYVQIASGLAADLQRLGTLRSSLRGRMSSSVLMDAPRFARDFEAALRTMWRRWCES
ncbi:MAG TPA: hypothetical protein VN541_00630, partial [Tepidisphaeraceae bacterium]|nr:hypothetical protein [Tepidisphaeraceae bacterium]